MIDETLTMIPGPTPVHRRILESLAAPTVSHLAPEFVAAYRGALDGFRRLGRTSDGQPVIIAGGGTLSMEMALVNLVRPGDKVLVVSQGYFGDRYAELAEAFGCETRVLRSEWGRAVAPEEVEKALSGGSFRAVTMTHVDTSTGTEAPVEDYCSLLEDRDELAILDGVCATGGIDERVEDWGVDALVTAPQKAIGAPPGVAMCLFSRRALERRRELGRIAAYYADLLRWLPVMEDPSRYYSTPCVNEIFAVAAALDIVHREGLDVRFARHRRLAAALRAGLAALGFTSFTAADRLAPTLSVQLYPDGIEDGAFRTALASRGVVVAGGLGPAAGRAFRLGHMGNIGAAEVVATLEAIGAALSDLGAEQETGVALTAAAAVLGEVG